MDNTTQATWKEACERDLAHITPILEGLGYTLDTEQPHMGGERYLMQSVTTVGGKKLILLGTETHTGRRVVIKATTDAAGKREIEHERLCRALLHTLNFAYGVFDTPEELLHVTKEGYLISVQAYLEQELPFTKRPTPEQFAIALRAFKAQESAHATTYGHVRRIQNTFGRRTKETYLNAFDGFMDGSTARATDPNLAHLLTKARSFLAAHLRIIEQYGDFLTHTDFVPHNLRVVGDTLYLLDLSSLRFGNKYEGWARFTNFMELYNPELAAALVTYVRANRTPEESLSFKLMRIYRLGEIIWYYTNTLARSSGDLLALNQARITWWTQVLAAVLNDTAPSEEDRTRYIELRDRLRSPDERRRQQDLH